MAVLHDHSHYKAFHRISDHYKFATLTFYLRHMWLSSPSILSKHAMFHYLKNERLQAIYNFSLRNITQYYICAYNHLKYVLVHVLDLDSLPNAHVTEHFDQLVQTPHLPSTRNGVNIMRCVLKYPFFYIFPKVLPA